MAEVLKRVGPTQVTSANTVQTILTAGGAGTTLALRDIMVCNTNTAAVVFSLGIDTAGTDAAAEHYVHQITLQPNEPWPWYGLLVLAGHASTPDKLYAMCDTAAKLNITISYVEGP